MEIESEEVRKRIDLYNEDFYAWTQHQAALLKDGDLRRVDIAHLIEEVETLGRKEVSELRSRLRILCAHLLEEMYQPDRSTRSWKATILEQRIAIADHIGDNPSLKPKLPDVFARAYADGRDLASIETGLTLKDFPVHPPFSYDEAVSRTWLPPAQR